MSESAPRRPSATDVLKEEHSELEQCLDDLAGAIRSGLELADCFRRAGGHARLHYRRENAFLDRLALDEPGLAAKMGAQHADALELSARFEEALAEGQAGDALSLARRFLAVAQHNIIEEERDVFPLADRCFSGREQEELARALSE
jgi:hypothetical protein